MLLPEKIRFELQLGQAGIETGELDIPRWNLDRLARLDPERAPGCAGKIGLERSR